jgi:hypothetical protein
MSKQQKFTADIDAAKEEWGVVLPNGREVWDSISAPINGADLSTEEGRGKARDSWRDSVEWQGLDWDDTFALKFVRRLTTVARTANEEVV